MENENWSPISFFYSKEKRKTEIKFEFQLLFELLLYKSLIRFELRIQ